jgi:hypothetical protein
MRRPLLLPSWLTVLLVLMWKASVALPITEQWQPINPDDLAMKDNPAQPGSDAMILYRENFENEKYVDVDGSYVDDYVRIKVFTDKGVRWGDVEIPFFKDSSEVEGMNARTIRPDGLLRTG